MSQELIKSEENAMVIARAETDTQINTAKAYPRNPIKSYEEALAMATIDQETAESCFYCLARRGSNGEKTEIKGASIRLAEIIAYAWGNLHAATRITSNDGKHITAEGVAWDLEKNIRVSQEVKRSIKTKTGATYGPDMQQTTSMAASSIALRNALFKVIPKHFINKIYEECVKTAIGDVKSINKRAQTVIGKLQKMGLEQDKIYAYLGITKLEEVTPVHVESLIGIGTSLKEGILTLENALTLNGENNIESKADEINNLLDSETK